MESIDVQTARYVVVYYSSLMTQYERQALRHLKSITKLDGENDPRRTNLYYRTGWLSTDANVLSLLSDGEDRFLINCTQRILKESPQQVFLNLCPVCDGLARTPDAKQCRFCGHD